MALAEPFLFTALPDGFYWLNEPTIYRLGNGLEIVTDEKTDFWQRTHYGFRRDDGHCLLTDRAGDFSVLTHVEFRPMERYDQCGLIVRADAEYWIKTSTEYEDDRVSRLGSVVTNLGYSDWATQDVSSVQRERWYRISKRGSDFLIESSPDGRDWLQMRIAHLHATPVELAVGVYACSPIGKAFWCRFSLLEISENRWLLEDLSPNPQIPASKGIDKR
jgi:regulation of enolase protein 1 (concanavalin A-like superfamily)